MADVFSSTAKVLNSQVSVPGLGKVRSAVQGLAAQVISKVRGVDQETLKAELSKGDGGRAWLAAQPRCGGPANSTPPGK